MSVQVSYTKQFLLGILLILVLILVLEGVARILEYKLTTCHFIHTDIYQNTDPNVLRQACYDNSKLVWNLDVIPYQIMPNLHSSTMNIDSDGFRGPEISKEKPPGTYRIFVIGGSTTFGSGALSDDTTIPGYLQHRFDLANLGFKVQVINAGKPFQYSLTETERVKNQIVNYDPDLLIVYGGWNDLGQSYDMINDVNDVQISSISKILQKLNRYLPFWRSPQVYVAVFSQIHDDYYASHHVIHPFDKTGIKEKVSLWVDRWNKICTLGKAKGFDTLIALQPLDGTGNKKLSKNEQQWFDLSDHSNKLEAYRLYANELSQFNETCTKSADLRSVFDGMSDPIYYDSGHMGNQGNEIIAEKLYELSLPIVKQKMVH